jgi:hypothetical protein
VSKNLAGVCILPEQSPNKARSISYPDYIKEILQHAGLAHHYIDVHDLNAHLGKLRVLVTVGEFEFDDQLKQSLHAWLSNGGCWLSLAGICGMSAALGVQHAAPAFANWHMGLTVIGEGYAVAEVADHPIVAHIRRPLHFFLGLGVKLSGANVLATAQDRHGRDIDSPLITEHQVGKGRAIFVAVDVTGTIVRVQQGTSVTRDGLSAPDGTAPVADGVLKTDDGAVLDWIFDRRPVEGAPGLLAFLDPVADLWREVVLRGIFHLARTCGISLPLLWLYPRQLPAIAHMSHDTDTNDPVKAEALLRTLAQADIKSTWCTILPGYPKELTGRIRSAGHELAMHYDAMTEGLHWSARQFDRQFAELTSLFDGEKPDSNKNHYLRWENDTELWEWCIAHGIRLDQSKGASKTGEAGFNFGSCHPYRPVQFDGAFLDILELATPTQDLIVFAPEALIDPMLDSVKRSHGVMHLLFHPAHIDKPGVAGSIITAVRKAKAAGLEWWTARQIHRWEFARRAVSWIDAGDSSVTLRCEKDLDQATILWLKPHAGDGFSAWGFEFDATTHNLPGKTDCQVRKP